LWPCDTEPLSDWQARGHWQWQAVTESCAAATVPYRSDCLTVCCCCPFDDSARGSWSFNDSYCHAFISGRRLQLLHVTTASGTGTASSSDGRPSQGCCSCLGCCFKLPLHARSSASKPSAQQLGTAASQAVPTVRDDGRLKLEHTVTLHCWQEYQCSVGSTPTGVEAR